MGLVGLQSSVRLVSRFRYHIPPKADELYSSLLFCGRLADIYGRKLCYLSGLTIFFIFNILSAVIKVSLILQIPRLNGLICIAGSRFVLYASVCGCGTSYGWTCGIRVDRIICHT